MAFGKGAPGAGFQVLLKGTGLRGVAEADGGFDEPGAGFGRVGHTAFVGLGEARTEICGGTRIMRAGVGATAEDVNVGEGRKLACQAEAEAGGELRRGPPPSCGLWRGNLRRRCRFSEGWWRWRDLNPRPEDGHVARLQACFVDWGLA